MRSRHQNGITEPIYSPEELKEKIGSLQYNLEILKVSSLLSYGSASSFSGR